MNPHTKLTGIALRKLLPCLFLLLSATILLAAPKPPAWVAKVGSATLKFKKQTFLANNYGARPDGYTLNTQAIQKAIDECAAKGGGVVKFSPGKYLTGSLFVRKNVNLQIDKGVEILGSQNIADYPEIDTRVAGIEMKWPAALINIIGQQKAAVTGDGIVNAQGKPFWDFYWNLRKEYEPKGLRWIVDYDAKRPRTLLVAESSDILIKGPEFQQAGFWTIQLLYSTRVTVDGVTIRNNIGGHGPSTDGIDVDSSSWVLIQNSDIDCNDDNFCLKAGRDWDGLRVNRPTEYVVIRDCVAGAGAGLLTLGSETAGSIRHVWASNLKGTGTGNGLNIKSATTRGGIVEDIWFTDIEMTNVANMLKVSMNWNPAYSYSTLPAGYTFDNIPPHWKAMLTKVEPASKGIPTFRNVNISNVRVNGVRNKAIWAEGLPESMVSGFQFQDITVNAAASAGSIDYAKDWTFQNVMIETLDSSTVVITNSKEVSMQAKSR
ncbi:MAG: glycoside hydrolase family 28 protein [Arcticibacter sp.]